MYMVPVLVYTFLTHTRPCTLHVSLPLNYNFLTFIIKLQFLNYTKFLTVLAVLVSFTTLHYDLSSFLKSEQDSDQKRNVNLAKPRCVTVISKGSWALIKLESFFLLNLFYLCVFKPQLIMSRSLNF